MLNKKHIECIIMDWAGTAIDYGCFAPVEAFVKAFEDINVTVTTDQVRIPMGMAKIEHIRQLLQMDSVNAQFLKNYNREWDGEDIARLNRAFEAYLFSTLANYTDPIAQVVYTISTLRQQGLKIGSTTGYTRAMMDIIEPMAKGKGYFVDNCVTPDSLPGGRPAPFMIYRNMIDLNIQSPDLVVKVGDTIEDIREGLNAKVWTVGVIMGSNILGLSVSDIDNIPESELKEKMSEARRKMLDAGAHYVIDSISELPSIIQIINHKYE